MVVCDSYQNFRLGKTDFRESIALHIYEDPNSDYIDYCWKLDFTSASIQRPSGALPGNLSHEGNKVDIDHT